MNYITLEKELYTLSEKEIVNMNKLFPSTQGYDGEIFHFEFIPEIEGQEYFISKHNRFKPVMPHIHGTCEISYIYDGECTQYINGEKILLQKGDILILDKKVVHSIEATGKNDIMINFQMQRNFFTLSFLQQLWGNSIVGDTIAAIISDREDNNFLIFHTGNDLIIRQSIKNILCEHYDHQVGSHQMINAYMMILFGQLLRSTQYYVDLMTPIQSKSISIANILGYIESNFVEGSLEKAAKQFSFSPTHISRILKKSIGKSFKELIHEQRLKQAAYLLRSTNTPIYTISEQIGYSNLNYFYLKFKEKFKMLPMEYRKKFQLYT